MRNFTARRCCGGAQSGTRPSKIEEMGDLKWACPLCSIAGKSNRHRRMCSVQAGLSSLLYLQDISSVDLILKHNCPQALEQIFIQTAAILVPLRASHKNIRHIIFFQQASHPLFLCGCIDFLYLCALFIEIFHIVSSPELLMSIPCQIRRQPSLLLDSLVLLIAQSIGLQDHRTPLDILSQPPNRSRIRWKIHFQKARGI